MALTLGPRARAAGYGINAFDHIGSTNAEALTAARGGCGGVPGVGSPVATIWRVRVSGT